MADEFDFSAEADEADVQASLDSFAAARSRDDQARFVETARAGQDQAGESAAAMAQAGAGSGANDATGALEDSPVGRFGRVLGGAVDWMKQLPKNIGVGLLDATVNTFDAIGDAADTVGDFHTRGTSLDEPETEHLDAPTGQLTPMQAYGDWRATINSDADIGDKLTQGVAQFAAPFTAFSKAFGVARELGVLSNGFRLMAADAVASATAFAPHDGRAADLIELGLSAENKFGDVMRDLAPDGSLQNQYIEWMTDRENETEMGGRFKNAVDGLTVSAALAGFVKTAALTFKGARKGVQKIGDAIELRKAHVEWKKSAVEPAGPKGGRETYTGLEFEDIKDAESTVDELAHRFGPGFEERHAAARNAASDKNFATLHSFSNVLRSQPDKPVKTHSLIVALHNNIKGDTETGAFYKELLGRLKAKNLGGMTTVVSKTADKAKLGNFKLSANQIDLYPAAFEGGPTDLLHTFTHEAVHKATMREIRESPHVSAQLDRLHKQLTAQLRGQTARSDVGVKVKVERKGEPISGQDLYGFTNPEEFVAEIESNPRFRKAMQETLINGESAWDKYLKAIAGILGLGGLAINPEFSKLMDPQQEEENDIA